MRVDSELLSSGGNASRDAGEHLLGGAARFSATAVGSSVFGDFEAARSFHGRLSAHQIEQATRMRNNHQTLTDVGTKAKAAAVAFAETEDRNRSEVDTVFDA